MHDIYFPSIQVLAIHNYIIIYVCAESVVVYEVLKMANPHSCSEPAVAGYALPQ